MADVAAETLDLSRLPAPLLLAVNYESDLAERKARLLELFDAADIPYDLSTLETDPAIIVQEVDNYREMLAKVAINDTYKQTLVAFATGASLDWFAANSHFLARMDGEQDERFRRRIQLENENKSGGRLSGYKLECMNASLEVSDVGAWVDRTHIMEPIVRLAIMVANAKPWVEDVAAPVNTTRLLRATGGGNGSAPSPLVAAVQAHVDQETVKQATDVVAVQSVSIVETHLHYTIFHRRGPDPLLLRASSARASSLMLDARHVPHRDTALSTIAAAATVGGVDRVAISSPSADLRILNGQLSYISSITVESAFEDG